MTEEHVQQTVKRILYVNRRAPHGTIYAQEALDTVLIGAAFDQDVSLLFLDDGIYQLKSNQTTDSIGLKNFSKAFRALELYDVDKIYIERESLDERAMSVADLVIDVEVINRAAVTELLEQQDIILSF